MNKSDLDILKTERAQVIFILLFIIAGLFGTIRYVVLPQRQMADDNKIVRSQLALSKFAGYSINSMQTVAQHEMQNLKQLSNEWARIATRLSSYEDQSIVQNIGVDRIDYKVRLYEIRERLESKSSELNIPLVPKELGLVEDLDSGEAVRVRMLQLKAVEKVADLTLDRQITRLVEIYPLPPVEHKDAKGKHIFTEYPVRIECDIDFAHLYTSFQSVFEENQVFAFRNIRIESGPTFDAKLRVKAVLSALLFD
ncbi:MAG: hypothetical protein PF904_01885 [Kiritimatiellae bacterium]|jgi:hypothetical protein|nr:hypothetical protein [Kiritimatiellia bacterium]